jgi:hypothetical protein
LVKVSNERVTQAELRYLSQENKGCYGGTPKAHHFWWIQASSHSPEGKTQKVECGLAKPEVGSIRVQLRTQGHQRNYEQTL